MESRIIKIVKNTIYFTSEFGVHLNQTNFPKDSISFKYHLDIYLEVELLHFDVSKKTLEIKILDYSPENTLSFNNQKLKRPISQLIFRELEWNKLQKLLSSFLNSLPKKIPDAFKKEDIEHIEKPQKTVLEQEVEESEEISEKEPKKIIRDINFNVHFSDVQFYDGYASISKNFEFTEQPIEFKIYNELIRSEYNYIKYYFSNYFNKDTFIVSATIKTKGKEVLSFDCESKTIQKINEEIIENVKNKRTLNITRIKKNNETEKNIFTANEILSKLDSSSNVFEQTEFEILMTLIESESPRNVEQLVYLSGKKHERTQKIRFTLNPLFGFIFFISGKNKNHICWELLNSHATYIWSFNKELSIESQIELSELNINTIKNIGRKDYRSKIKNEEIDINSIFNVINHSKSKVRDGFEIWKNKIERKII